MKLSHLTAATLASGLLIAVPAFAQTAAPTTKPVKPATTQVKKQHTDGEDVTGNSFPRGTSGAMKQHTEGEDVTGNNNFPAASK